MIRLGTVYLFVSIFNMCLSRGLGGIFVQDVDVFEVAAQFVVIQSETDDELVLDGAGDVVDVEFPFKAEGLLLKEKGADFGLLRPLFLEETGEGVHRITGIDDIFHDDDCAAFDIAGEGLFENDFSVGAHSAVGRDFQAGKFTEKVHPAQDFCREGEGTVEHADDDGNLVLVFEIPVHFFGDTVNVLDEGVVGDVFLEYFVVQFNPFHNLDTVKIRLQK